MKPSVQMDIGNQISGIAPGVAFTFVFRFNDSGDYVSLQFDLELTNISSKKKKKKKTPIICFFIF